MIFEVKNKCSDFNSYRAARVKSLFNAEKGCDFNLTADLGIEDKNWSIGLIVGASGSGKSTLGKKIFEKFYNHEEGWDFNKPIIDCISPDGDFNEVTAALSAVGLGDVPAWLRPFHVLSNGQKFRAGLARLICEKPDKIVVDEFTSVVDRQIAKIGSQAFQKSWRRSCKDKQIILLSCHYDIIDWLNPDWVYDTSANKFERGLLRQRPKIELEIRKTNGSYWKYFKPHYYLDLPMPPCAEYFVGSVDGEPVCHVAVAPKFEVNYYRSTRLVVMPEWQGAGVGTKFLEFVCQYHLEGNGRCGKKYSTLFHTSHPQLIGYTIRSKKWVLLSQNLYGGNKTNSGKSINKKGNKALVPTGYGGHFRAVQGFKYIGEN